MRPLTDLVTIKLLPQAEDIDDTTLNFLVSGVSIAIGNYCNQSFYMTTYDEKHSGDNQRDLYVNELPVKNVDYVQYLKVQPPETHPSNEVEFTPITGEVRWSSGIEIKYFTDGWENINVHYTAGYDEIPKDLQMACATWVLATYLQQQNLAGLKNESLQEYSYTNAEEDVNTMPDSVRYTLDSYRVLGRQY